MTDQTLPTIAILGAGSMGGAILAGLTQPGVSVTGGVHVTNRSAEKARPLAALDGVTSYALDDAPEANRTAAAAADVVLIGVKPAMVPALLDEIAPALRPGTLVISLAAGVTCATFEAHLPSSVPVIRSMPNTPAVVGRAMTGLAAGSRSGETELALARAVFTTVGEVVVVPESKIDALSTISGSGPAYVFYLIEQFTTAAMSQGFDEQEAASLVQATFRGASELLAASGETPAELRRKVTSPKGTTERAVAVLEQGGLAELFTAASNAALARARELAAG